MTDGRGPGHSGGSVTSPGFDRVYEEHVDFVWRSMRRLGVPEPMVDDAVQETFLVVHRRLPDFEGRSSLKTWIFSIALGIARNFRRSAQRRGKLEPIAAEATLLDPSADPEALAQRAQAVKQLDRILDELDDDKRAVFVMAEIEQLTAPEIAEILGVKLNTVYSRLRTAREAFDRAVQRLRARDRSAG